MQKRQHSHRHTHQAHQRQSQQHRWRLGGRPTLVLMLGGLFALIIAVGMTTGTTSAAATGGILAGHGHPLTAPVGEPAIIPRFGPTHVGPTFTASDASAYVVSHPMWRNLAPWMPPTVERVAFLTSKQVSALLHVTTGLPASTLLCYVQMQGTFTFAGAAGTTVTYHTGFEVFNARTGNFLMAGGLP